jgi:hypothetical protein
MKIFILLAVAKSTNNRLILLTNLEITLVASYDFEADTFFPETRIKINGNLDFEEFHPKDEKA